MDSSKRKTLKNSVIEFYKLHHDKGKLYTYKAWKNCGLGKTAFYAMLKKFDNQGNIVIIKMFDNLKAKVHKANQFGLRSLDK